MKLKNRSLTLIVLLSCLLFCLSLVVTAYPLPNCDREALKSYPNRDFDEDGYSNAEELGIAPGFGDLPGSEYDPCDPCKPDSSSVACRRQKQKQQQTPDSEAIFAESDCPPAPCGFSFDGGSFQYSNSTLVCHYNSKSGEGGGAIGTLRRFDSIEEARRYIATEVDPFFSVVREGRSRPEEEGELLYGIIRYYSHKFEILEDTEDRKIWGLDITSLQDIEEWGHYMILYHGDICHEKYVIHVMAWSLERTVSAECVFNALERDFKALVDGKEVPPSSLQPPPKGPSGGQAAAAGGAAAAAAAVWAILNGLSNAGTSPISRGGGGTGGGTSISPLIDPDTGEPLAVQDETYEGGKPGQVWYDGQWLDRGTAAQWIAERRDELTQRQHERESFWSDVDRDKEQRIRDRADHLRDEGYVYDPAQDAWVPGQDHPSVIEQQRLQEAQQLNDFIERNVDDLARTDFLQDLVDRVRVNGGDMNRLRNAIMDNTVRAEHQAALAEAAELQGYEDTAAGIRDWSQRANRVIGWATGVGPVINAWQNAAYGTVQGYEQGGWHGAFTSAAAQLVDELVENYTHVPGTGTAFRDAYGTGYEKDKDGNWTSPMDRFTGSLWHGVTDQYDPTKYIDRCQEADGLGDYFDIGMDAVEAIGDVRDFGRHVQDAYDRGIQIGDTEGKLPIINGSKDGEFSRRGGKEAMDNITGRSDRDIPDGPMTEKTQRMADNITTGDDGKPYARLDDVLEIQRSTQDTRSLKSDDVNPQVPEGFKNTLREQVYDPHDDALKDYVRNNVPGMENRELRVHDFRTPGADSSSINTDRDYHVQYKDDKGDWIEINRRRENVTSVRADDGSVKVVNKETVYDWEKFSQDKFAELTGYDSDKVRDSLPTESQRQAWDNMSDADKKARWAEMHSQTATDKYHTEASSDYSDQGLNERGDRIQKKDDAGEPHPNILDVKEGGGTLDDPRALADQYHEKADLYLRQGNEAEAIAQIKKGVDTLEKVRSGYEQHGLDVGKLPADIQDGMKIISDAKVDHRADPAEVEQKLRDAGFGGIDDFNRKLGGQIESMKFAQEPATSVAPEPPSASETSGASRSSISTRLHWQDFKENEEELTNSFAERAKDFMRRRNK